MAIKKEKKERKVSIDVMARFLMQQYGIPNKKDVEALGTRLKHIEDLLINIASGTGKQIVGKKLKRNRASRAGARSASNAVLEVVRAYSSEGLDFAKIQEKTGFEEKKLRNIIFRLNSMGKIKRQSRGIYVIAEG